MRSKNELRAVKLVIGFEGTHYEGWQSQRRGAINRAPALQDLFEKILLKVLKEKTNVISSSRTDSGVHALALVAHFRTKSGLPDSALQAALNHYLPRDVVVFSAKTVSPSFHARYSAKSKLYRYDIWNHRTRPLFEAPFVWWCPWALKVAPMRRAARALVGRHDFSAFKDSGDERKSHVRTIKRIRISKEGRKIRIEVEADGFLRHMVRVIVGTLVEVGRGKTAPAAVREILRSKDRKRAGPTVKARGLTLVRVRY